MMNWLRAELKRLRDESESGQAMVEFVVVFPLQLTLTLAIIQYAFILHAQVVVGQAAFLGARAAAVADMVNGVNEQRAAQRVVARQLGILTSGGNRSTGAAVTDPLRWPMQNGMNGYAQNRQNEVYTQLQAGGGVRANIDRQTGFATCEVSFDYIMSIPVANHFFARLNAGPYQASQPGGFTAYRVRRVGFVATPWTRAPQ